MNRPDDARENFRSARQTAWTLPPARELQARKRLEVLDAYRAQIAADLTATNELHPPTPLEDRREPPLEGLKRAATGAAFILIGACSDAPNATLERAFVIAVGALTAGWGLYDLHRSACHPRMK